MNIMECEQTITWEPKEIVELGNGCKMGITSDDGHYIVLSLSHEGSWKPSNWIPPMVAKRLGELAGFQIALANAYH